MTYDCVPDHGVTGDDKPGSLSRSGLPSPEPRSSEGSTSGHAGVPTAQ